MDTDRAFPVRFHPMTSPLLRANSLSLPPRLRDFSIDLNIGQTVGLLGPNGAGKSTALAVLAGALAYQSGQLHYQDEAKAPARQHIGWLPQHSPLYPEMRVIEQLRFTAGLHHALKRASAIEAVVTRFELQRLTQRLCGQLSGGEQRRVALACAMIHQPKILLLDEPSSGLDVTQTEAMRHYISQLANDHAILLASHQSEDIQGLCHFVCLMADGRLLSRQALHALDCYRLARFSHPPQAASLCEISGVRRVLRQDHQGVLIELDENAPASMPEKIACRGWGLQSWEPAPLSVLAQLPQDAP